MSFLFGDTFDYYASADMSRKWSQIYTGTNVTVDPVIGATGRHSSNGARFTATNTVLHARGAGKILKASGSTAIFGFAFKQSGGGFNQLTTSVGAVNNSLLVGNQSTIPQLAALRLTNSVHNGVQVSIGLNQNGTITAWRANGTNGVAAAVNLGTSTTALSHNTYQFLECKVVLSQSATGSVEIRLNGISTPILTVSSIQTVNGSSLSALFDEIVIGECRVGLNTLTNWDYDDFRICDGSGSFNNDFLGDLQGDALFLTADGAHTDSTPSTGTARYAVQDETTANGDTDYTTLTAVNAEDSYAFQNCPTSGVTVSMMQVNHWVKRAAAGNAGFKTSFRISGVDYLASGASEKGVSSDYTNEHTPYDRSPVDGSGALSTTLIDNAEVGIKKTT